MLIGYRGNFKPAHSTENEVRRALQHLGHEVTLLQEDETSWLSTIDACRDADLFLWTQTYGLAHTWSNDDADTALRVLRDRLPTVGYHLDRWWGLTRQDQIQTEPFFRVGLLCTADGGHDQQWADAGINHRWFPPAVSEFECEPGTPRDEYRSDIAFVGSWQGHYHREWGHRSALINFLHRTYRRRVAFHPRGPAVRGADLRDLYASVKVVIGDSCLVPHWPSGDPMTRYWSDRVPETIGRGAFLLHPYVEGLPEKYPPGAGLALWALGDWNGLRREIDYWVANDEDRAAVAKAGQAHVLREHTYTVRMRQLLDLLQQEGML